MSVPDVDIVIVGAGACGLTAALRAAEREADVLLLEKDSSLKSNTEISDATIVAADTRFQRAAGIQDSPELMAEDIMRRNGNRSDPKVTLALCRTSREVVDWLVDEIGYPLELARDIRRIGQSVQRGHSDPHRGGGHGLVQALRRAVEASTRITYVDRTPGRGLIYEDGAVRGVRCGLGEPQTVYAHKVILACDGFGANRELLARFCPAALPLTYIGVEGNTGDGILWGAELGAALDHMTAFQGQGHVVAKYGTVLTGGIPIEGGLAVNVEGHRFAREDVGYSEFAMDVIGQPEGQAIEIFDERILGIVGRGVHMRESREVGAFQRYETLDDLAIAFHIDPGVLRETVKEFHRAAKEGSDRFGRTRFGPPLAPPYYAGRITGGLAHTQGGLRVDARGRVLRPDNSPIENVYAGGGTACGLSGDGPAHYSSGNGLLAALGLGTLAARDAAAALGHALRA